MFMYVQNKNKVQKIKEWCVSGDAAQRAIYMHICTAYRLQSCGVSYMNSCSVYQVIDLINRSFVFSSLKVYDFVENKIF